MAKIAALRLAAALGCVAAGSSPAWAGSQPVRVAATPAPTLGVDTPIEKLAADPKARPVLDHYLPGLTSHPHYETFKDQSLRQLMPISEGQLTPEKLAQIQTALSAIH